MRAALGAAARNPVFANLLMIFLIVGGLATLVGMTRVSLGRGTLRFGPPRTVRFEYDAETVEYELTNPSGFRRL